jgi:hypothetical protein
LVHIAQDPQHIRVSSSSYLGQTHAQILILAALDLLKKKKGKSSFIYLFCFLFQKLEFEGMLKYIFSILGGLHFLVIILTI